MEEYIEKNQLKEKLRSFFKYESFPIADIEQIIDWLPVISKHGMWIPEKEIAREFLAGNVIHVDYLNYRCSVCGAIVSERETIMYHFCPNCGARMDLDEVEE